ncbi:integrase [Rhodoligotrophos appendicifer]|uniref:site-specific integrase n=1 Tax=Rhodoligotrophos appendicifer TaxID=987056 RepID=UPI0014784573|nr:tyrosine-type recombinase/integrase [Rhodoligotrophos appendicifer]
MPTKEDIAKERSKSLSAERIVERYTADQIALLDNLTPTANQLLALDLQLEAIIAENALKDDIHSRTVLYGTLREHLATGETALVSSLAAATIPVNRPGHRQLCMALQRAWLESLERTFERDKGNWAGKPTDPIVDAPALSGSTSATGRTIMELFEDFARENPRAVKPDSLDQSRKAVRHFASTLPSGSGVDAITKASVFAWKQLLMQTPVKAAEIGEFKGLTPAQVVKKNEKLGKPNITPRTVNKLLTMTSGFIGWLKNNGFVTDNPVAGMLLPKQRRQVLRSYSIEQLGALFGSPLYRGCLAEKRWHIAGNVTFDDHRRWLPLLALFTGARMGELAQLETENIREQHGVWTLFITNETTDGDEKAVKNRSSIRTVPIHDELIKCGFIKQVEERRAKGEGRLFPDLVANTRDQIAGAYSREFGKFLEKIGIKLDSRLNFHSLRHTFADGMRRAGYLDYEFAHLLGHVGQLQTSRYGDVREGELTRSAIMINAISYPGLNLQPLHK